MAVPWSYNARYSTPTPTASLYGGLRMPNYNAYTPTPTAGTSGSAWSYRSPYATPSTPASAWQLPTYPTYPTRTVALSAAAPSTATPTVAPSGASVSTAATTVAPRPAPTYSPGGYSLVAPTLTQVQLDQLRQLAIRRNAERYTAEDALYPQDEETRRTRAAEVAELQSRMNTYNEQLRRSPNVEAPGTARPQSRNPQNFYNLPAEHADWMTPEALKRYQTFSTESWAERRAREQSELNAKMAQDAARRAETLARIGPERYGGYGVGASRPWAGGYWYETGTGPWATEMRRRSQANPAGA